MKIFSQMCSLDSINIKDLIKNSTINRYWDREKRKEIEREKMNYITYKALETSRTFTSKIEFNH